MRLPFSGRGCIRQLTQISEHSPLNPKPLNPNPYQITLSAQEEEAKASGLALNTKPMLSM